MSVGYQFTPEQRARGTKALLDRDKIFDRLNSKKAYKRILLQIGLGEVKVTATQLNALGKYAQMRGWYPPQDRRNTLSKANVQKELANMLKKPELTPDVAERITQFPATQIELNSNTRATNATHWKQEAYS